MRPPFSRKKPSGDLRLKISRVINSFYGGIHRSVLGGRGSEFKGLRPYDPADNPRDIDWPASAKFSERPDLEPISRTHHPERRISVVLAIDVSPSMSFPARKFESAFELLWLFLLSAFRYRDRAKIIFFGNDLLADSGWLNDESASEFFLEKHFRPEARGLGNPFLGLTRQVVEINLFDSLFVLISDFAFANANTSELFRRLDFQKRNVTSLAIFLDEWEGFDSVRHGILLKDPESEKTFPADMRKNSSLSKMAEEARRSAENIALGLRPAGFSFIGLPLIGDTLALAKHEISKLTA